MRKDYLASIICVVLMFCSCGTTETVKDYTLFVGTYTKGDSEGVYSFTFNSETGELKNKTLAAPLTNPSFLKISPNKKYLYAIDQTNKFEGTSGAIAAFSIENGQLKSINTMPTVAGHACHVGVSGDGNFVAASSYGGGSISVFKIDENGALFDNPQYINHKILDTIKKAKAHASKFTSDGLFTADLGLDAVKRYTFQGDEFIPSKQPSIDLPEGAGPRHFTFGQDGKFLYVINELNATITVFERNIEGIYIEIEVEQTLSPEYKEKNSCADIHLSKDGRFLYGSNRGENTIVIFKVDEATGKLTIAGRESVHGDWPRNFTIDPTDNFLLVANERSSNITVFKRDIEKGTLTYLHEAKVSSPVCLEFLDL